MAPAKPLKKQASVTSPPSRKERDELLAALLWLAKHHQRPETAPQSLTAGLPLEDGKLTVELFLQAARRAGLHAKSAHRQVKDLQSDLLPAVVIMKNGKAAILTELEEDGGFKVIYPAEGNKEKRYKTAQTFARSFAGTVIWTRPLTEVDTHQEGHGHAPWFWGTLRQFSRVYAQVGVATIVINLLALASPLFVMNVYDRVVPNAAYETLWVLASGVALAFLFDFILKEVRGYFIDVAGRGADILMASKIYRHMLDARLGQHNTSAGAFANQVREFESLREFFTSTTLATFVDLPFILVFVAVIGALAGPVALVPLLAVPLVLAVSLGLQAPLKKLVEGAHQQADTRHGHLVETITSLENIKSLGLQSHMQKKWESAVAAVARLGMKSRFLTMLGINLSAFLQQMVTVVVVVWGVYRITDGDMTVGALIACTILTGRALAPLGQAAALYIRLQQSRTALEALDAMMKMEVERPEDKKFLHLGKVTGRLECREVSFTYPEAPHPSLKDFSCLITPGEKVGIVGRSGSGKSTLARLLAGLYQPAAGTLLLDNLDMRQLDPAEYRAQIGYVPQQVSLFRGTLRENLAAVAPGASEQELLGAIELVGLPDFVRSHPQGLDMPIGEGGANLSGGQRQAIGIARACLKDPQIMIMDEPTSQMDQHSESILRGQLAAWLRNRTVILVSHRPSLLTLVNRVLVLEGGRLQQDSPREKIIQPTTTGKVKK